MAPIATPTKPISTTRTSSKPTLNMSDHNTSVNPSQWLNFSLPPRQRHVPGSGGLTGVPRRSRKGDSWRGGPMSRERYVQANFRFMLKPNETLSYGAHFADPDISLHWPNILQVLVPTFSAFSVAQGYVSSDAHAHQQHLEDESARSFDEDELDAMPEDAAQRRRRIEEERRGRMCPICLGKPVAGRMTKCGHIFCFPCILHFIQLSDIPKSARCPICGDTVHEGMLKSVKYLDATTMLSAALGEDDEAPLDDSASTPAVSTTGQDAEEHHHVGVVGEMDGFEEAKVVDAIDKDEDVASQIDTTHQQTIHMRLVQRPQMTTLALPSSPTWPSDAIPPHTAPWSFLPDILSFSRFMLATPEYMLSELHREHAELKAEWDLLQGDELGRDFVRAAREKVERQMGKVKNELMTELVARSEVQSRDAWGEAVGGERREKERRRERERRAKEMAKEQEITDPSTPSELLAASQTTFDPNRDIPPNVDVRPNPMPPSRKSRRRALANTPTMPPTPSGQSYYFYQSSLGANVFLHPLDIRILLAHFKSYSLFPQNISFTSSGFDPGTINDELRKRCKYLGHLPAGTEVIFVEAELEEIVGKEGLVAFEQPLRARREKRRARTRKEDRAKIRWEQSERDKIPLIPAKMASREDEDFNNALIRSAVEQEGGQEILWNSSDGLGTSPANGFQVGSAASAGSSSFLRPSPGSSPSQRTFASTLGTATSTGTPVAFRPRVREERKEDDFERDAVWEAFNNIELDQRRGTERETEKGGGGGDTPGGRGGKKGGKKGAKKTLVLGGGGRGAR